MKVESLSALSYHSKNIVSESTQRDYSTLCGDYSTSRMETLTILIPVYNEEHCIPLLTREVDKLLAHIEIPTSVLFIDDGSKDHSLDLIEGICTRNKQYSFISFARNQGLSTALKAGIDACHSSLVGYIDADLQTSPEDFLLLLPYMNEYDLAMGYREKRNDTLTKRICSNVANTLRRWLLSDNIIDTGCPLKIMRTSMAKRMPFFSGMHRLIPDMVMLLQGKVKQVPIHHYPRLAGKSKYHVLNRLVGPLIDLAVFRWMQRNSIRYHIKKCSPAK
jgi:dolichol-phosphate mannosyltransferase